MDSLVNNDFIFNDCHWVDTSAGELLVPDAKSGITFIRYAQNLEYPSSGTLKTWNTLHQVRSKPGIPFIR
jgi:hypothetical protein